MPPTPQKKRKYQKAKEAEWETRKMSAKNICRSRRRGELRAHLLKTYFVTLFNLSPSDIFCLTFAACHSRECNTRLTAPAILLQIATMKRAIILLIYYFEKWRRRRRLSSISHFSNQVTTDNSNEFHSIGRQKGECSIFRQRIFR